MTVSTPISPGHADEAVPVTAGLSDVLALAVALAEQVQVARAGGLAIPPDQVQALVDAAQLLREAGADWPPAMTQVLVDLAKDRGMAGPSDTESVEDIRDSEPTGSVATRVVGRLRGILRLGARS